MHLFPSWDKPSTASMRGSKRWISSNRSARLHQKLTRQKISGAITGCASLVAGLVALGAPAAWSAPLLGWYRFDDPTNLGRDSGGSSANGSVSGTLPPLYSSSGYRGGAAEFQGQGWLQVPFNTGPSLWPSMTWGGWVKPSSTNNIRQIVTNDNGAYDRTLGIDSRSAGNYSAFMGNSAPFVYNTGVAPTSDWTFIAGVYNDNAYGPGLGKLTLYIGTQVFDNIQTAYDKSELAYTALGGSPVFAEYWDGWIDDFFVIGGAVTPSLMATIRADPDSIPLAAAATPNGSETVPAPLPLLGAAAALRASRRLRRRMRLARPVR